MWPIPDERQFCENWIFPMFLFVNVLSVEPLNIPKKKHILGMVSLKRCCFSKCLFPHHLLKQHNKKKTCWNTCGIVFLSLDDVIFSNPSPTPQSTPRPSRWRMPAHCPGSRGSRGSLAASLGSVVFLHKPWI